MGARSVAGVRRSSAMLGQWGAGGALFLALIFALAGPQIIDIITTSPEVRAEARQFLPWLVAAPLIGVASWILDGVFIGATQTREMMRAMLISVPIYGTALMLLVPLMGNHGLWASLMVLNATRGVTMLLAYPKVERQAAP